MQKLAPGIKTEPFVINRPGEYEINNIFITGHATNKKGEPRNTIFVCEINGLFVAHMGNINRPPTQTEVENLGTVNVLLIPVGGGAGLNAAQAVETIRMIQPNIVIPMHYRGADFGYDVIGPVEPFLSLAGNVKKLDGMSYTVDLSDAPATVVFERV